MRFFTSSIVISDPDNYSVSGIFTWSGPEHSEFLFLHSFLHGKINGIAMQGMLMADSVSIILSFVIALIISTVIIYVITKVLGEKEGITTAILAALIGTIVYTVVYYVLDQGFIAAFIAGIVWLLALQTLYTIGWLKSLLIAVAIWIVASIVEWFLPTLSGPV